MKRRTGQTFASCARRIWILGAVLARPGLLPCPSATAFAQDDSTPPVIAVVSPTAEPSFRTGSSTLHISGSASDNVALAQVTWTNDRGGSGTAIGTSSWSVSGIALQSGVNIITVTAMDTSTNVAADTLTVHRIDTEAPAIFIASPTSFPTHSTGTSVIGIAGSASDNAGVVEVTWSNDRGGSGTADGTASWTVAGIQLQLGANLIAVTARDAAGNGGSDAITINLWDTTPPTVTITSPTGDPTHATGSNTTPLAGTASDNIETTRVTWVSNRGGSGTATGTTSWTISEIALQSGANIITVTATDSSGNTATDEIEITLVSPVIEVTLYRVSGVDGAPDSDNPGTPTNGTAIGFTVRITLRATNTGASAAVRARVHLAFVGSHVVLADLINTVNSTLKTGETRYFSFDWTPRAPQDTGNIDVIGWIADLHDPGVIYDTFTPGPNTSYYGAGHRVIQALSIPYAELALYRVSDDTGTPDTGNPGTAKRYFRSGDKVRITSKGQNLGGDLAGIRAVEAALEVYTSGQLTAMFSPVNNSDTTLNQGDVKYYSSTITLAPGSTQGPYDIRGQLREVRNPASVWDTYEPGPNHGPVSQSRLFNQFVVDDTAPSLTIATPTGNTNYIATAPTLDLGGNASDNASLKEVEWVNNRGGAGTATGTSSWLVAGIALQQGVNVITVTARDEAGNYGTDVLTVTWADQTPPSLTAISAGRITSDSAVITWLTDEPADTQVEWEPADSHGASLSSPLSGNLVTSHSVVLEKLSSNTRYRHRVKSKDASGNLAVSGWREFSTTTDSKGLNSLLTLSFPCISTPHESVPGPDTEIYTGVAVANLDTRTATLRLTACDDGGAILSGPNLANPQFRTLAPGEQLRIVNSELFGSGFSTSNAPSVIKIESDVTRIAGFFLMFTPNLTEMDGANLVSSGLTSIILPEISGRGFTRIHLSEAGGKATQAHLELVGPDGDVRAAATRTIPANGALAADLFTDLFPGLPADPAGYIRITTDSVVVPYEFFGETGRDISALGGQDPAAGSTALYCPQYVVGGAWRSALSIVNLDAAPGLVTLRFVREDGAQIGPAQTLPIARNGKVQIDDQSLFGAPGAETVQGYLEITSDGIRLAGSVVFGDVSRQSFSSSLALVSSLQTTVLFSHIASNSLYFTGIAILNPNNEDATATIEIHAADGRLESSINVSVPAGQRRARLLTEYFPELQGRDLTSGYIRVNSDKGVACFALFGTNSLSVLAAVPPQLVP